MKYYTCPVIQLLIILAIISTSCTPKSALIFSSEQIRIEKVSDNTYMHVSFLNTEQYGKVPCNGMIAVHQGEAIIFDTPVDKSSSEELIQWVRSYLKCEVKAVVVTHFHVDCLGGLRAFHDRSIPSYSSKLTQELASKGAEVTPENAFNDNMTLTIGNEEVITEYLGEGHTKDNVVSYFPTEKVLFGGCLIKSIGAGKGNLDDANVAAWSETVEKVKRKYKDAILVIPGHGNPGGVELLDFTIDLFKDQ